MNAKTKLQKIANGKKVELIDVEFRTIQRYCSHAFPYFDCLFILDGQLVHQSQLKGEYFTTELRRNNLPLPSSEDDIRDVEAGEPTGKEILTAWVKCGDIQAEHLPTLKIHLPIDVYETIRQMI